MTALQCLADHCHQWFMICYNVHFFCKVVVMELSNTMYNAKTFHSVLLYFHSTLDNFYFWMQWGTMLCCLEPHITCSSCHLLSVRGKPLGWYHRCLSLGAGALTHWRTLCKHLAWLYSGLCHITHDTCHSMTILSLNQCEILYRSSPTSAVIGEILLR